MIINRKRKTKQQSITIMQFLKDIHTCDYFNGRLGHSSYGLTNRDSKCKMTQNIFMCQYNEWHKYYDNRKRIKVVFMTKD